MEYKKLRKIYYTNELEYELEYEKRFNSYGTYRTNLFIKPVLKDRHVGEPVELFVVNIKPLMKLNEEIILNSFKIRKMITAVPTIAITPYFEKLLVNELQGTNEIEGVRSTKKELSEILSLVNENKNVESNKNKRFIGLMKTYKYINEIEPFTKIEDFRKLYDDIVADEVEEESQPDGELFRKGSVEISDGLNRATHVGIYPESNINEYLGNLLLFLNSSTMPDLFKYMVAHFYYEYVHPFYDGNGRTGRLFVCSYVSKKLDDFTAVTLSYTINKDKNKYYKALEELSDPKNRGDATLFCQVMLEILKDGQESLIEDLSISLAKVKKITGHVIQLKEFDETTKRILLALLSVNIFAEKQHILTNKELQQSLNISRHIVNKSLTALESKGIVTKVKNRPVAYDIDGEYVDKLLYS